MSFLCMFNRYSYVNVDGPERHLFVRVSRKSSTGGVLPCVSRGWTRCRCRFVFGVRFQASSMEVLNKCSTRSIVPCVPCECVPSGRVFVFYVHFQVRVVDVLKKSSTFSRSRQRSQEFVNARRSSLCFTWMGFVWSHFLLLHHQFLAMEVISKSSNVHVG